MTTSRARLFTLAILVGTVAQLAVATFVPNLEQFEGKAFGGRLLAYPVMMLAVPLVWWWVARRRHSAELPWGGFAFLMLPFLVDVTGNTFDLYDSIAWWDDANHLVNWFFLCLGAGLLLRRGVSWPAWAFGLLVAGVGALLAIGWELGEWYAFIRHGTELDTAYTDTLGDEALGTLGGLLAGLVLASRRRRALPR